MKQNENTKNTEKGVTAPIKYTDMTIQTHRRISKRN